MRLRVRAYRCNGSYLSFISLQSCRCDTGAAAERAGEGPGAPGRWSLPAREEAADGRRRTGAGGRDIPSSLSRVGSERGTRVTQNRRVLRVGWQE